MKDIKEFTHINPPKMNQSEKEKYLESLFMLGAEVFSDDEKWKRLKEKLETEIVDKSDLTFGAITVAELMSEICFDKADHLRANWQDKTGAEIWEKAAIIFEKTAYSLRNLVR